MYHRKPRRAYCPNPNIIVQNEILLAGTAALSHRRDVIVLHFILNRIVCAFYSVSYRSSSYGQTFSNRFEEAKGLN